MKILGYTLGAVFEIRDNFTLKLKSCMGAAKQLKKDIDNTGDSVSVFGSKSDKSGGLVSKLKKEILGLAGAYVGLQGASKLAHAAIGQASSMEGYRNTLNIVMKDTKKAAETMAWAAQFANKTPFETNEVVDATVKLQNYGLVAKDVLPTIGDMAGVMNKSLDQAVEAVADAQTGELERLKEFGITKQMIIDQANKIMRGKEIVNNKGQITDQKAFNQALLSLMQERFKGGMELQAKTLKGTWSTVVGVAKNALGQLMGVAQDGTIKTGGLFDKLKGKVNVFADTLQKWSQDGTIDRAAKRIEDGFNAAGKAIGWVKDNLNWLVPVVSGAVGMIGTLKVIGTINDLFEKWTKITEIATGAVKILNITMSASTFGIIVLAIGAVIAAGVALYMHWDTVKAKAVGLWNTLKEKFNNLSTVGKAAVIAIVGVMTGGIGLMIGAGIALWKNWDTVKAKAKELWESIKNTFENIKKDIIEKWQSIKDFLKHPITGTVNLIKKATGEDTGTAKVAVHGSHASGLDYVPFDGYIAELHKGERVQTAKENPYNPQNRTISENKPKIMPQIIINIDAKDRTPQEIVNEILPPLKLALVNVK